MPSREAAQLGVSGLGSQAAVKRAGAEKREADVSAAAHDRGKARARFRVRRRCGVRVQRSHRRTLSTKSDATIVEGLHDSVN